MLHRPSITTAATVRLALVAALAVAAVGAPLRPAAGQDTTRARQRRAARDSTGRDSSSRTPTLNTIVVTGTVTNAALREVPNVVTVITAKEIRERGIATIDQLFRGEVPGIFSPRVTPFNPVGEAGVFARGNVGLLGGGTMKVYVDGVEAASPEYFNTIDPNSIEKIEILPGPQAANLYGGGAIAGVLNVFLKKGRFGQPAVLRGSLAAGTIQSPAVSGVRAQHDHTLTVEGGDDRLSYSVGGSLRTTGEWVPGVESRSYDGVIGGRRTAGWLIVDGSARFGQRRVTGAGQGPVGYLVTERRLTGEFGYDAVTMVPFDRPSTIGTQTLALGVSGAPRAWWEQRLTLGRDASAYASTYDHPRYTTPSDSLYDVSRGEAVRTTAAYNTTLRAPGWGVLRPDLTLGADMRRTDLLSLYASSTRPDGALTGAPSVAIRSETERGYFGQARLAVAEALYLTAGLRAERNPNYGDAYGVNYAPRVGAAYNADLGPLTVKLRASYGRATRPPSPFNKTGSLGPSFSPTYGEYRPILPSPEIGPESQRGVEGGIDVYLGARASAQVTHFDQTVDGAIVAVPVDSVRSLQPSPVTGLYTYIRQNQFLNLGRIANNGWETRASVLVGPVTVAGTYSWTRSRVVSVDPRYTGPARPGDSFQGFAEHTGALSLRYRDERVNAGIVGMAIGQVARGLSERFFLCSNARLPVELDRLCGPGGLPTGFVPREIMPGYWMADADAAYRMTETLTPFVRVQNLTNATRNETNYSFPAMGRVTMVGLRIR